MQKPTYRINWTIYFTLCENHEHSVTSISLVSLHEGVLETTIFPHLLQFLFLNSIQSEPCILLTHVQIKTCLGDGEVCLPGSGHQTGVVMEII